MGYSIKIFDFCNYCNYCKFVKSLIRVFGFVCKLIFFSVLINFGVYFCDFDFMVYFFRVLHFLFTYLSHLQNSFLQICVFVGADFWGVKFPWWFLGSWFSVLFFWEFVYLRTYQFSIGDVVLLSIFYLYSVWMESYTNLYIIL